MSDMEKIELLCRKREQLGEEIKKVIVGQAGIIEELLISLFCGGHSLLIGVPGLAKTSIIKTFSEILDLKFRRIQFTPDLMPADITGTEILADDPGSGQRVFKFVKGPVFANIILADEINRTPPKTQAALLEAMQEYRVTSGGVDYPLEKPFFVLATQNPIEQEGTYPLPEAQLDRFMFSLYLDYPEISQEIDIVKSTTSAYEADLKPVMSAAEIIEIQKLVRGVPVSDDMIRYAVELVDASRPSRIEKSPQAKSLDFIREYVSWGAGPRASQYLVLGAKARAILDNRPSVSKEDIRNVAYSVLRHRILTNFRAELKELIQEKSQNGFSKYSPNCITIPQNLVFFAKIFSIVL